MKSIHHLSQLNINSNDRVLVVTPHPDDEAVFLSGLLHQLSQSHIATRVLVMTRGEKSTLRYGLAPTDDLAIIRTREQQQAFSSLGIGDYQILEFPDGGLETKIKSITPFLKKEISQFKPTHLVTLEPEGIYGHPDHIALTHIVTGFGSSAIKILYATLPQKHFLPSAIHMSKKKAVKPIRPQIQLRLSGQNILAKLKALGAHRSQLHPLRNPGAYFFFLANRLLTHEFFAYKK